MRENLQVKRVRIEINIFFSTRAVIAMIIITVILLLYTAVILYTFHPARGPWHCAIPYKRRVRFFPINPSGGGANRESRFTFSPIYNNMYYYYFHRRRRRRRQRVITMINRILCHVIILVLLFIIMIIITITIIIFRCVYIICVSRCTYKIKYTIVRAQTTRFVRYLLAMICTIFI